MHLPLVRGNGEDYMLRMLWKKRTDSEKLAVESRTIWFVFSRKSIDAPYLGDQEQNSHFLAPEIGSDFFAVESRMISFIFSRKSIDPPYLGDQE